MAAREQQVQIAETIRAMKVAFKRRPDDSDSGDDYQTQTNRGFKLKRSARYVREGRLDNTGRLAYKKTINHAGYTRAIISTNPTLYDSEGEPGSPTSSGDERNFAPIEENPFAATPLETLLKPLTALEDLADHPSLGVAYREKALTQMAAEAAAMLRTERENLWRAKRLLKRFEGDADWVPCANFEGEEDASLLLHDQQNGGEEPIEAARMQEVEQNQMLIEGINGEDMAVSNVKSEDMQEAANGQTTIMENEDDPSDERRASADPNSETASTSASNLHAMTTRARARSPRLSASPSPSPSDSASVPAVHPWFIAPSSSLPDRDLGLPADEAETTRKMLLLYCQKQEQIIRSLDSLYSGLQKGDRLRKSVLAATKAAGHLVLDGKNGLVTEMSDGEDWYDPVEYGRLEKGKDEVEDIEEEGRRGGRRRRVVGRV
ncbi:hypothetical protein AMS68_002217 [Peltaster fructicola]|uniref:Transcriptional regulatory protein RXT2 N-terminal domain-containing protein n=1 Tax=Peltaster fructicola TaxID=286661 RepID=A0A6H0XQE8_9PEZI|nr:hypothetical protein AMS68_002217 [Peltaster fructicola]